jgi:hypothetical protein
MRLLGWQAVAARARTASGITRLVFSPCSAPAGRSGRGGHRLSEGHRLPGVHWDSQTGFCEPFRAHAQPRAGGTPRTPARDEPLPRDHRPGAVESEPHDYRFPKGSALRDFPGKAGDDDF